jgi:uncharacterized membrane protein YeaQ/YmgE (transglycosylase-associated protein family)
MAVSSTCDLEVSALMHHISRDTVKGVAMDKTNVLIAVVMGVVAGWLASFIVGGGGLVQYLVSGILGSFVGSFVLNKAAINLGINNEIARDIITATIGAIIVMIIANILT